MQILPLHRFRIFEHGGIDAQLVTNYGDRAYLTPGNKFVIRYLDNYLRAAGWWVASYNLENEELLWALSETGLFDHNFPRRKDAIDALENALQIVEATAVSSR